MVLSVCFVSPPRPAGNTCHNGLVHPVTRSALPSVHSALGVKHFLPFPLDNNVSPAVNIFPGFNTVSINLAIFVLSFLLFVSCLASVVQRRHTRVWDVSGKKKNVSVVVDYFLVGLGFGSFFFFSVVAFTHTRKRFIEEFQLSELVLVRGSIKLQLWHPFTGSFCIFEFFFIFFSFVFQIFQWPTPPYLPSLLFFGFWLTRWHDF